MKKNDLLKTIIILVVLFFMNIMPVVNPSFTWAAPPLLEPTWETYASTKFGYSIKYPSALQPRERNKQDIPSQGGVPSDVWFGERIHIITRVPPLPDDVLSSIWNDATKVVLPQGLQARRLERVSEPIGGGIPLTSVEYLIRANGADFFLVYTPLDVALADDQERQIFEIMITTFAVIEQRTYMPPMTALADQTDGFDFPVDPRDGSSGRPDWYANYNVQNPYLQNCGDSNGDGKDDCWSSCYNEWFSKLQHAGEDWFRSANSNVYAVANGRVIWARNANYPGGVVIIEHSLPSGVSNPWGGNLYIYSMYGHLDPNSLVSELKDVQRGQIIGRVYNWGSNSHVHFEMRRYGNMQQAPEWVNGYYFCNTSWPGPGYTDTDANPDWFGYTHPSAWIDGHRPGGGGCNNPSPNSDQIGLYADDNYCGAYKILGIGEYPNPGALGVSNDSISSIKVGGNVKATLCRDDNYGGCEDFTSDDSHLGDNSIGNDSVSSAKVTWRSSGNTLPSDYGYCAEEGHRCSFSGTAQIYYGANNQYVGPRTYTDGVDCNNSVFGDPIPGIHKQCFIKGGRPQGSTWCANENGTCSFGNGNVATVYYGANGKYNTKTGVVSSIACDNSTFGDPFGGIGKACYYIITGSSISTPSNPSPADNVTLPRTNNTVLSWSTNGTNCTIHIWGGSINISPTNNCDALTLGQQRGGAYSWQVTSSNSSGSATGPVWHFNIKPYTPTNLTISNSSASQVTLNWSLSSDEPNDVDEYYIYRNDQYVGSVSKGTSTYTITGLSCDVSYSFNVKSRRQGVLSDASNTVYRGPVGCPPAMPTNLIISNSTMNSLTLSWQDNSNNESGFKIYRWGYDDTTWNFYYLDSVGANITSYTQTNLSCGNDFNYYEVSAFNQYGESAHAGWVQGTTATCPPAELLVTDITFYPSAAYSNDNVYAYVSIQNQSNQSVSSFWIDVYIDDQPSGCSDWGEYYFWVDEIGANSINTWMVKIPADTLTSGSHQVRVFVDSGCNVTEGNENNNIEGPIQLQLLTPPPSPLNDEIDYAKNIFPVSLINLGANFIYEDNLDVTGAHISPDDPYIPICDLAPGLSSVWYKYTPLSNETIRLSTFDSNYDTFLAVWNGSNSNLELVGCNDDYENDILQSELNVSLVGGITYYFEIAEWNGYFYDWGGIQSLTSERQPPIQPRPGDTFTTNNTKPNSTKNYWMAAGDVTIQSPMAGGLLIFKVSYPEVYLPVILKK